MKHLILILAFFIPGCDSGEASDNTTDADGVGCCAGDDGGENPYYVTSAYNTEGWLGPRCSAGSANDWYAHYTCEQLCDEWIAPRSNDEYTYTCSINGEPYPPEE